MPKKIRVFVKKTDPENPKEGEVIYIHSETAAKAFLGSRESPKVSDIRFDPSDQMWFATLRDGREIFRNENRDVVVREEAIIINEMFSKGEWIPGGYNVPQYKLSHELQEALDKNGYSYLGRLNGFDLYYSEARSIILAEVSDGLIGIVAYHMSIGLELSHIFPKSKLDESKVITRNPKGIQYSNECDTICECSRRSVINDRIKEEEKIKNSR